MPRRAVRAALVAACPSFLRHGAAAAGISPRSTPPSLAMVEKTLRTTASDDFGGRPDAYESAIEWQHQRLEQQVAEDHHQQQQPCPYLACFENGSARVALSRLETELLASPRSVRRVSLGKEDGGACFLVTVGSPSEAAAVSDSFEDLELSSFAPFPSALKLAPGLLNLDASPLDAAGEQPQPKQQQQQQEQEQQQQQQQRQRHQHQPQQQQKQRLTTTHGKSMHVDNVEGLNVELSPGLLPAHDSRAGAFISDLLDGLMSTSVDLHASNFWSDAAWQDGGESGHTAHPAGAVRAREWGRAADVVHELSTDGGLTPGDVCSWGHLKVHHAGNDVLLVSGLDHLLEGGRGAGGSAGAEADELHLACFMGLVSYFASRPEVLRVAPFHKAKLLNAVARAISQSATITKTPLTDARLDGSGEVIQVVDSGLDQESCFFRDEDGEHVEGGHYYDEIATGSDYVLTTFTGGYYPHDLNRRKVVQYISLIRPDAVGEDNPNGDFYTTARGRQYEYYDGAGFATEIAGGHGSHTAGTAAGVMLDSPAELEGCSADEELGCVGGCFESNVLDELATNGDVNLDTLCPAHNCDGWGVYGIPCLTNNGVATLTTHGGFAPGAKIAVFDVSADDGLLIWAGYALNGLWDAVAGTGCKVHSNSWAGAATCQVDSMSVEFDGYMYENPEHLLIFAAGNDGDDVSTSCTISSPGIGKNVLAVGSSSSGGTRYTVTGADGERLTSYASQAADIDTVSYFSSYGPSTDNRIKPELVAPGDMVLSVSSSGGTGPTCGLEARTGSSMSAPVVAGSAAMIRQYFKDSAFYLGDLEARGLCANDTSSFVCQAFSPSAATVKAVLINSANLMGGSSEPDGFRGFGRVHLEAGLPLDGAGFRALLVDDSARVAGGSVVEYTFQTDGDQEDAGEFRATLAWIDPPSSTLSSTQLIHDLDLAVTAPSGKRYTMWSNGRADRSNIIERVIISASDFAAETNGTWTVSVSAGVLSTESQSYSLVVLGPFGNGTAIDVVGDFSTASPSATGTNAAGVPRLLLVFATVGVAVVAGALLM